MKRSIVCYATGILLVAVALYLGYQGVQQPTTVQPNDPDILGTDGIVNFSLMHSQAMVLTISIGMFVAGCILAGFGAVLSFLEEHTP